MNSPSDPHHDTGAERIDAALCWARALIGRGEAELLLAHALERPRSWLFAHDDHVMDATVAQRYRRLVERRVAGEPVAYLLGQRGFWRFDLAVTPATLIPRPETERLVELALSLLPEDRDLTIADLGTGSGAIALALAFERPRARVIAVDFSADALEVARANAASLQLGNVEFRHGDWFAPLAGERFDLIASNPPYIEDDDVHLQQGDLRHEPRSALASGADGLDAIRVIARDAPAHLQPGGWLLIEHGWEQGAAVRALLTQAGLVDAVTERDLEERDRVSLARKPGA
ncbi:protein-(glutamine-N5) methyltransferase, release factor-specific [Lysobacter antibioticus]|uniref:peptide chain release factor N(5)-glutamine methyltransferase n=1 Tax=Lysobacter antibioticus TaxID=84531 RepID=UPI000716FEAC|nr:peptide chain release factor N(5)-glutamine methyltransferase [Lysobacter antibioticus]ALN64454.1 protein-(glutamine-N5) methyltransferase, release factor-specific [Lysobacter antibioticus]